MFLAWHFETMARQDIYVEEFVYMFAVSFLCLKRTSSINKQKDFDIVLTEVFGNKQTFAEEICSRHVHWQSTLWKATRLGHRWFHQCNCTIETRKSKYKIYGSNVHLLRGAFFMLALDGSCLCSKSTSSNNTRKEVDIVLAEVVGEERTFTEGTCWRNSNLQSTLWNATSLGRRWFHQNNATFEQRKSTCKIYGSNVHLFRIFV